MELQQVFTNLKNSEELIAQYADRDDKIWKLKTYAILYNRTSLFKGLGIVAALAVIVILGQNHGVDRNFSTILIMAPLAYISIRYLIGNILDSQKRRAIARDIVPEIHRITEEMNELADRLDSFTILPSKYRTLHAVNRLQNYIIDRRIDTLKEGFNLYEDELFKNQQLQNQQAQINQNHQMIQQNNKMIKQNDKMIRQNRTLIFAVRRI